MSSLLLGAAGGALVGGRPRRAAAGALATLAGLVLVGIAASGPAGRALHRVGTRRRTAHLRLSFVVPQPVSTVFRFCADFENYPKFIRAVREVHDFGDGRSHWVGWAPNGRAVEWDAVTTKFVPNRVVAWQSTPRSVVRTSCTIRVVPERAGGTCVKVAIDYSLPTERIKDAVTALTSRTRTRELEADIRRLGEQLDALPASA
ncbi:MAG TPA: SRPBCC family protein [Gemmatimonadaceae bacterium]|nr:SRPBCC family protein [Gemmatimonadaceae bacterium]